MIQRFVPPSAERDPHRRAHREAASAVRATWRALHRMLDKRDWLWSEPAPPWCDRDTGELVPSPGYARDPVECGGHRVGWLRRWRGVQETIAIIARDVEAAEQRWYALEAVCHGRCALPAIIDRLPTPTRRRPAWPRGAVSTPTRSVSTP